MLLQRLQAIFIALSQAEGRILLFIDPLDRLLGGEWVQYPISAAELLKPVLVHRQIQLIGVCSLVQYKLYIERGAAVQRRFQGILMPDVWKNINESQLGR